MLEQKITIKNATAKEIYELLLDSEGHTDLISDKADVSDEDGYEFSTFSGYSTGRNKELIPNKAIEQTWRANNWLEGHYSTIRFEFEDSPQGCVINFTQKDLPDGSLSEFEAGWEDFYWHPLREYFGNV